MFNNRHVPFAPFYWCSSTNQIQTFWNDPQRISGNPKSSQWHETEQTTEETRPVASLIVKSLSQNVCWYRGSTSGDNDASLVALEMLWCNWIHLSSFFQYECWFWILSNNFQIQISRPPPLPPHNPNNTKNEAFELMNSPFRVQRAIADDDKDEEEKSILVNDPRYSRYNSLARWWWEVTAVVVSSRVISRTIRSLVSMDAIALRVSRYMVSGVKDERKWSLASA